MKNILFLLLFPFYAIGQTVNAGIDQTINLPQNYCTLYGGGPNFSKASPGAVLTSFVWQQIAGPVTVVMSRYEDSATNITSIDSVVFIKGMTEGRYTFRLTVKDSKGWTGFDDVNVTIQKCAYNDKPKDIVLTGGVYWPIDAGKNHNIKPGDRIILKPDVFTTIDIDNTVTIGGIVGCHGQPITIIPMGGKVKLRAIVLGSTGNGSGNNRCSYVQIDGSGIMGEKYGIQTRQIVAYTTDHIEVNNIEIRRGFQSGIHMGGYEPGDTRDTFAVAHPQLDRVFPAFYKIFASIHDNYIDTTDQEGMYLGASSFGPGGWNYPNPFFARGDSFFVYNNIVKNTGRDGIQFGSAGFVDCRRNYVDNTGTKNEYGQQSSINFGTGCYGNVVGNYMRKSAGQASVINGYGNILYEGNYIDSASWRNTDASVYPSVIYTDGSQHGPETLPLQKITIRNNYIRNPYNPVRDIFSNDYPKNGFHWADTTTIVDNKLFLPNFTGTDISSFVEHRDNDQVIDQGDVKVSSITFPTLPLLPVSGPVLYKAMVIVPPVLYTNKSIIGSFTRNNCGADFSGGQVTYTVPVGKYTGTTQADADTKALADIAANGQSYANANGSCTQIVFHSASVSKSFTRNNCPVNYTTVAVIYSVAANKYSGASQVIADSLAIADINTNGQNYANANGVCTPPPRKLIKTILIYDDYSIEVK